MRNRFAEELLEIASEDEKIILLAGDIGFRIFDKFIEKYPNRFINCGIAEQNMISIAAGMASEGMRPVVYTIIPFLVMRAFEQIRVDIGINAQPVILVGVGGGLAYDKLGSTHHAYEDVSLMRTIPNMKLFTPYDPKDTAKCLLESYKEAKINGSPSYIRLSKGGEENLPIQKEITTNIHFLKSNKPTCNLFITHGSIASIVLKSLQSEEYDHVSLISISELSQSSLIDMISFFKKNQDYLNQVTIVEETFAPGGLHEALTSLLSKLCIPIYLKHINIDHKYIFDIDSRENLLQKYGINSTKIKEIASKN